MYGALGVERSVKKTRLMFSNPESIRNLEKLDLIYAQVNFLILPQLPQKILFSLQVAKNDSKIILI
jgi:hypothetical protein